MCFVKDHIIFFSAELVCEMGFKFKYFLMDEILSPLTFCILRILRFPSTFHNIPLFDTCTLYAGTEFKKTTYDASNSLGMLKLCRFSFQ